MTHYSLSHLLGDHLLNRHDFMTGTEEARVIFRLLHRADLSTSMAWHSIWHGSERTPWMTRC